MEPTTVRTLSPLLKKAVSSSGVLRRPPFFPSLTEAISRTKPSSIDDSENESPVYKQTLKFQRPSTITYADQFRNSVSFIGVIDDPIRKFYSFSRPPAVYTRLRVNTFRILLVMRDEMAEMSLEHLKPHDLIYVWGHLESEKKAGGNGKPSIIYKVNVKEINYIEQYDQGASCQKPEDMGSRGTCKKYKELGSKGSGSTEKYQNRLHLWQIFFASPFEWRDCRKSKVNPKHPDFTHRDSGEALWISNSDPSWVKRQLKLHDSRISQLGLQGHLRSSSQLSSLAYNWLN